MQLGPCLHFFLCRDWLQIFSCMTEFSGGTSGHEQWTCRWTVGWGMGELTIIITFPLDKKKSVGYSQVQPFSFNFHSSHKNTIMYFWTQLEIGYLTYVLFATYFCVNKPWETLDIYKKREAVTLSTSPPDNMVSFLSSFGWSQSKVDTGSNCFKWCANVRVLKRCACIWKRNKNETHTHTPTLWCPHSIKLLVACQLETIPSHR